MYSKDELLSKNIAELEEIAEQIGIKVKSDDSQEDIIYSILDKQAEVEGNKNPLGTKRRRVRIVKKDTDRVYSVNGKEGENFDLKKNKIPVEAPSLFNDIPSSTPAKAKSTRSKAKAKTDVQTDEELQAVNEIQEAETNLQEKNNVIPIEANEENNTVNTSEEPANTIELPPFIQEEQQQTSTESNELPIVPEAEYTTEKHVDDSNNQSDLIAQLQAKVLIQDR